MEIQNNKVSGETTENGRLVSATELDKALECIGKNSKHALLYYLQTNYNIFSEESVVEYEDLEKALNDLVGAGASILLGIVKSNTT